MNPCLRCVACQDIDAGHSLDYQEIDGASNNSVDNIRDLIENVRYLPARGEHKIYVIDEVHMLSTPAFNALLKTLEEPPAHVIFIFATTEAHKLLGTILSRCQRFDFKSVPVDVLSQHLHAIIQKEGIRFTEPKFVRLLAEYGKGSVRDALSLLDQVLSLAGDAPINEEIFFQSLGLARAGAIRDLLGHVIQERPMDASRLFQQLLQENIELKRILDQVLESLHGIIQSIDNPAHAYAQDLLPPGTLNGVSFAELFWVYETLVKDVEWALNAPSSEKVVDVVLQKLARRRQILQPDRALIPAEQTAAPVKKKPEPVKPKTPNPSFEALVESMGIDAPTIKGNLEMGNFLEAPVLTDEGLRLVIGFRDVDTLPRDYLQDTDVMPKFKTKVGAHFGVPAEKVSIKMRAVPADEAATTGFEGLAEKYARKHQDDVAQKRERLLNDPYVKEAEKLFGTKVDKVILKD